MKKILFLAGLLFINYQLNAQDCTPFINTGLTTPGLTPSQLPDAVAGIPYDEVIDWVIPYYADNILTPSPGDSIPQCALEVMQFSNLPAGFTVEVWAYHSPGVSYDVLAQTVDTIHIYATTNQPSRACIRIKCANPPAPVDLSDCLLAVDSPDIKLYTGTWADLGFGCMYIYQDSLDINLRLLDSPGTWTACDTQMVNNPGALCSFQPVNICPGGSVMVGTHTYSAAGTYYDIFTANNGCDSIHTTYLSIIDCSGIQDEPVQAFQLYPNPSSEVLTIVTGEASITAFSIIDLTGKMVYQNTGTFTQTTNIRVSEFTDGIYLIRIRDGAGYVQTRKFLVNH